MYSVSRAGIALAILTLTGAGLVYPPVTVAQGVSVAPEDIDFGTLAVDDQTGMPLNVRNDGDSPVTLDITLEDAHGCFRLAPDGGLLQPILGPGDVFHVSVWFKPDQAGEFTGVVHLGGGAPDVPLRGVGEIATARCLTEVTEIDFGRVPACGYARRSFRVTNTGTTGLQLSPDLDDSLWQDFGIVSYPQYLGPGEGGWVTVRFGPRSRGLLERIVELGPSACSPVTLRGETVMGGPYENLMTVSFSEDEVIRATEVSDPDTFVDAFLVLANPSEGDGVYGWEVMIETYGEIELATVTPRGNGMNFLSFPEFMVSLAPALPQAPLVVLADLRFHVSSMHGGWVNLRQVTESSLGCSMAYTYNADYELMPAVPWSSVGGHAVWVNPWPDIVPVAMPTPVAEMNDRRVRIRWNMPDDTADGCHVYRATDRGEIRLTTAPLRSAAGGYFFEDDTTGLPAGALIRYSYAVVQGGEEVARSPEVVVELPAVLRRSTRLLPNRPNPFNPETEIGFELSRAGQVRVVVFDAAGRRIASLVDGVREIGQHRVVWRGRDDAGRSVPSGAYYVRLVSETVLDTRKVLLLK